jgi:hypothetical protein
MPSRDYSTPFSADRSTHALTIHTSPRNLSTTLHQEHIPNDLAHFLPMLVLLPLHESGYLTCLSYATLKDISRSDLSVRLL